MFCFRIGVAARCLLGVKKISSHTRKTGSWYLLGVLFKISDEHPRPFYVGFSFPRESSRGSHLASRVTVMFALPLKGVLGLYKGLFTPVAFATPLFAIQFWAVTMGRKMQMSDPHGIPT